MITIRDILDFHWAVHSSLVVVVVVAVVVEILVLYYSSHQIVAVVLDFSTSCQYGQFVD